MKNKLFYIIFTTLLTANVGLCAEQTHNAVIQSAIVKFGLAMAGVVVSSVIIFLGLTIYNKFFVKTYKVASNDFNILKTPKNTEDAIKFFIHKNKLS